jgi:predicted metal-dependent hydrolase
LIEMNHSSAFWKQVESVYPDYLMARKELKGYR